MRSILILLLFCSAASAQTDEMFQIGGYVKYLFSTTQLPTVGRVNDHLLHGRINTRLYVDSSITAALELRNRIYYGGSVEHVPGFLASVQSHHDLGDGRILWWQRGASLGLTEIDRLWIDGAWGKFQITAGRQRIAFGTALVWNPIDLFNPLSILDFDYEERPAVDALRVQYFTGEVSKLDMVVKPGSTREGRVAAVKFLMNRWKYDIHLLAGMRAGQAFLGAAWAGDIAGAGFRGEILSARVSDAARLVDSSIGRAWSTSLCLSGDYTFPNSFYLHTELLYNNRGVSEHAALAIVRQQSLHLLSPARWSIYQELAYDVHPLVHLSAFVIHNPDDASSAWALFATWSALQSFDVSVIGLIFSGGAETEYGMYGDAAVVRGTFSF